MLKTFKKLGLTENEISFYLSALKGGPSDITTLAKLSQIKRTSAYVVMERLKSLGLISERKVNKQRIYQAEEPVSLVDLANKRAEAWQRISLELENLLPRLKKIATQNETKVNLPNVKIYEGEEMLLEIVNDFFKTLKQHKSAYQVVDSRCLLQLFGFENFLKRVTRRRRQYNETIVYTITNRFPGYEKQAKLLEVDFRGMKFADNLFLNSVILLVCGDKVWLGKINHPLFVTVIESQPIAELMKFVHQSLWQHLPSVI